MNEAQQQVTGATKLAPVSKDPAATPIQPVTKSAESRLYGDGETKAKTDIDDDTPGVAKGLGDDEDDTSSTTETDEDDSDISDDTPEDDDEADEGGYKQRFKDTQAKLTETSQQLAAMREEQAESMAELTRTSYELQDRFAEQEQIAGFWMNIAQQDVQRLQQVNVQQLNQQQYAQWQQQSQAAFQRAQQLQQALQQTLAKSKEHRESSRQREAAIARAKLTRSIENFDEAYPKLGQFAVSKGVNPQVFKEITDPGLIQIIHEAMQLQSQPDAIKKIAQTKQKPNRTAPNARSRMVTAQPKTLAQRLYKE